MVVFGLFATVYAVSGTYAKAESYPMQKNQTAQTTGSDISKVPVVVSGDDCCHPGADCCKGGACCHKRRSKAI